MRLSLASDIIVSDMELTRENNIVQSAIDKILPPIPCNFLQHENIRMCMQNQERLAKTRID